MSGRSARDEDYAGLLARLKRKGLTLRAIEEANGFSSGACAKIKTQPARRARIAVAEALGVHPTDLWPSLFDRDAVDLPEHLRTAPAKAAAA
jgi:Ner family transcriptional regulator